MMQPFSFTTTTTTTIITIIFTICLILIYKWYTSAISNRSSPPSPPKLPIFGNLHQLGILPHRSLRTLARQHGPLMLLHFGNVPVLVVSSAELAKQIMKTHDISFADRPKLTPFEKLFYGSKDIATSPYGEYWRQARSVSVLHLLSNKRVQSFRGVREEEIRIMMENIRECCSSSSPVNLSQVLLTLTNDVVCRVAVGRKYSNDGEGGTKFSKLWRDFVELLGTFYVGDYIPLLSWFSFVNGMDGRLKRVANEFDELLEKVMEEHLDSYEHNKENGTGNEEEEEEDCRDFADILIHVQKQNLLGFPIDRVCIKALIMVNLLASQRFKFLKSIISYIMIFIKIRMNC